MTARGPSGCPRLSRRLLPAVVPLLLLAGSAHANAGTGMLLSGPIHLLIGNVALGIFEAAVLGLLVRRLVTLDGWHSTRTLIAANYVSAFLGAFVLLVVWPQEVVAKLEQPLYAAHSVIIATWLLLFLLTVLVEAPFIRAAVRSGSRPMSWAGVLGLSLVVQAASYVPLTVWYALVCPITLLERTTFDPSLSFARGVPATVYYGSSEDGSVWAVRPDGTQRRWVAGVPPTTRPEAIRLQPNAGTRRLDLAVRVGSTREWRVVVPDVGPTFAYPGEPAEDTGPLHRRPAYTTVAVLDRLGDHFGSGYAWDLRPVGAVGPQAVTGFWPHEGVSIRAAGEPPRGATRLALETPFLALAPRFGTVVEGDFMVYEYALFTSLRSSRPPRHQIVVLNLRSLTLGVLADGRSPVVVLDAPPRGTVPWEPRLEQPETPRRRNVPR